MLHLNMKYFLLFLGFVLTNQILAQNIYNDVSFDIEPNAKYIFYLHGGIVQAQGANAVSKDYGPYEYQKILDTLASRGYIIISEVRSKDSKEEAYARRVMVQIDYLIEEGVPPKNIFVVGASLGGYIAVEVSYIMNNPQLNFAVIGLCSDYAVEYYQKYKSELCGRFLSIYETTDEKQSCRNLLGEVYCKTGYREVVTHTGIGHGFLYHAYPAWTRPLFAWMEGRMK